MDDRDDGSRVSRVPTIDDLVRLCRHLNEQNVEYVVIGGFAVIHHGYLRATADIDLLVQKKQANVEKIKTAMGYLEDQAARDLLPDDLSKYTVVRVADEIVVDLMAKACGHSFEDLRSQIEEVELQGVRIPYLTAAGLLKTKAGIRPKDQQDRAYLERLLKSKPK